jgi:hypothetical protein
MLVSLIALIIKNNMERWDASFKIIGFYWRPICLYSGWITVATIANVTTFLVSINWNMFDISEVFWTVAMIIVGAIVGFVAILYYKSFSYGLVIIWAYLGIAIKHLSTEFFDGKYPAVIIAVVVSILLVL